MMDDDFENHLLEIEEVFKNRPERHRRPDMIETAAYITAVFFILLLGYATCVFASFIWG